MTICQLPCGSRPSDLLTVALLPGTRRHTPCMSPAHHFVLYKFPLPSPDRSSLIFLLLPPPLWVANPSLIIVRSVPRTIFSSRGKVSPRLLGSRGDSFIPSLPFFLPSFLPSFLFFYPLICIPPSSFLWRVGCTLSNSLHTPHPRSKRYTLCSVFVLVQNSGLIFPSAAQILFLRLLVIFAKMHCGEAG